MAGAVEGASGEGQRGAWDVRHGVTLSPSCRRDRGGARETERLDGRLAHVAPAEPTPDANRLPRSSRILATRSTTICDRLGRASVITFEILAGPHFR
jgi:hypothetical protein